MSANEQCRLCTEPERKIQPDDDLPLCQCHWNGWLNFIFSDEMPPCAAHLIRTPKESQ